MALRIVVDLDDTLTLEREHVRSGFAAAGEWAARWLGIQRFAEHAWELFEKGARGNVFNLVLEAAGWEARPDVIESLVWIYRTHRPAISLFPDAAGFLDASGAPVAIITDGAAVTQSRKVEALGLDRLAHPIVLTDLWGPEYVKPRLKAFQMVAEQQAGNGARFVYLGDNPVRDIPGPRSLGWLTVRIRRPGGLHYDAPSLPEAPPDYETDDLMDALKWLRGNYV
jgi:putative hydrolase of the HAD superfamily